MGHQLTPLDFILCEVTHDKLIPGKTLKTVGALLLINKLAAGCDPLRPSAYAAATAAAVARSDMKTLEFTTAPSTAPSVIFPTGYFTHNQYILENSMVEKVFGVTKLNLRIQALSTTGTQWHHLPVMTINETVPRTIGLTGARLSFFQYDKIYLPYENFES